jgi:hypothetical protein
MVHDEVSGVYEVEFPDERGINMGSSSTFALSKDFMRPVSK